MQQHLTRAFTFLRGALSFFWKGVNELFSFAKTRPRLSLGIVVILVALLIGVSMFLKPKAEERVAGLREVSVVSVSNLSSPEPISIIGKIRSVSEAHVAPDASGAVAGVYRSLGEFVAAGTVIAELKNDTQRAGVQQAEAALEKAKSGTTVGNISLGTSENALTAAIESARNTITSAYSTVDDAVQKKADQVFSNPNGSNPIFFISTSNSQVKLTAESNRLTVQTVLSREANAGVPSSNPETLLTELEKLAAETEIVREFLASVVSALNGAIATGSVTESEIAVYRADIGGGLSTVNALKSSVSGAIENLKAKRSAVAIATENLSGTTGVNPDVRAAEANLAAARAQLEKTIIRAPISGTINRLDLDVGSFVNASVPVIYIANARGLEAVAYVSERDIADIVRGASVTIGGTVKGAVTKIATGLDPVTKKAEVRISVPESASFISGSAASLSIARTKNTNEISATPTIPLSSLKITPEGPVIFTVSSEDILVAYPVILGSLRGSKVEVASGLTPDMQIVEDARGLKDGQRITVNSVQ